MNMLTENTQTKTFETYSSSGSHMICDIKEIKNQTLLNSLEDLKVILDHICQKQEYQILQKTEHQFHPQGCTILYLLSESHISIHTFPEQNYIALDLYTCREYSDDTIYQEIYDFLVETLNAKREKPMIIRRTFV
jgi:S-adenosylmethionine decarboxylase